MDTLNEKIEGLVNKAEKSGMPYGILKKVYDRGMAAWKTGHRPGTTPQQWAFARVNSFITKSSGTWGKADADLAKQVRGEDVEKRKTAKNMLGQVREKLDKDSDAGDYVKDFKKSDAPQFKGKSDKKKEKMAVAAYLDSKEEVKEEKRQLKDPKKEAMVMKVKDSGSIQVIDKKDLEKYLRKGYIQVEDNIQEALKINYVLVDTSKNNEVIAMSNDEQGVKDSMRTATLPPLKVKNKSSLKIVKLKRPKSDNMAGKLIGEPLKSWGEETDIQESGHTDVASMKTQVQIATDALQKMNTELGKLSDEEDLPTWWTNKVATAVSKLDGMSDYISAKQNMGKTMKEKNEKNIQEVSSLELQVYMLADTLAKHPKFTDDMYSDFIDYAMDRDDFGKALRDSVPRQLYNVFKSHLDKQVKVSKLLNMSTDMQGKEEYKSLNESAIGCLQAAMIDNNKSLKEEKVFVVRFEKEGMRFAVPFRDMKMAKDGEKILKKSAGVSNLSVTQDILKPGIKLSRTQEGKIVKESKMGELFLDMQMDAQEMDEREFIKVYTKKGFQAAELKRMYKEFSEEVEKVDNSLASQTMRVISQTSIKEKIDPADVDNIATADDRKAADKNIIIQLRRAQDMQGKADVTFKDKPSKKEKIDIKVINKALDMFDKMRPNDKAKMQTMIGKSYRDLLKTVQRGRI